MQQPEQPLVSCRSKLNARTIRWAAFRGRERDGCGLESRRRGRRLLWRKRRGAHRRDLGPPRSARCATEEFGKGVEEGEHRDGLVVRSFLELMSFPAPPPRRTRRRGRPHGLCSHLLHGSTSGPGRIPPIHLHISGTL